MSMLKLDINFGCFFVMDVGSLNISVIVISFYFCDF